MNKSYLFVIHLVLIVFLVLLFLTVNHGTSKILIWFCLSIFYAVFISSFANPITIDGNSSFIKIDVLFYLFYYLIYYLPYQKFVLNLDTLNSDFAFNDYVEYTNVSLIASTISLMCFSLGFCIIMPQNKYYKKNVKVLNNNNVNFNLLFNTILILLVLLIGIYYYSAFSLLFSNRYMGSDIGNRSIDGVYFVCNLLIMVFLASALFYYKQNRKLNLKIIIISSLVVLWLIFLIIYGDRNTFFLHAIILFGGYYSIIKSSGRKFILFSLTLAIAIYSMVEITRTVETRSLKSYTSALTGTKDEISASSFNITTIGSRATYNIVEENNDFYYGKFKLIGIAGIIPFSRQFFVDKNDKVTSSSELLTLYLLSSNENWSVGTNIVSDIYLDFGIVGVVILMVGLGFFANMFQNRITLKTDNLSNFVLYLLVLSLFAELPRYSFDFPVRNLAWAYLFTKIFEKKG